MYTFQNAHGGKFSAYKLFELKALFKPSYSYYCAGLKSVFTDASGSR